MQFILPENLKFVKRFIERTFFGALKVRNADSRTRYLVETVFVDANQYVWCCCNEELPVDSDKFPVSLRYVDKVKGIYMKVTGMAHRIMAQLDQGSEATPDAIAGTMNKDGKLTLLKVKMTETVYYKKEHNGQVNFYAVAC